MKPPVSVDKAIQRGHWTVNLPAMLIFFISLGLPIYGALKEETSSWFIVVGLVMGLVGSWLYWSISITYWRLWAFEQVRNLHDLKKRAIEEKLIWPDESTCGKTEIRTKAARERLAQLEQKLEREDVHQEDYSLAKQTEVYYSKSALAFEWFGAGALLYVGCYFLVANTTQNFSFIGALCLGLGLYASYKGWKKATSKQPLIVIDQTGIGLSDAPFMSWSSIEGEAVVRDGIGNSTTFYLVYCYEDQWERAALNDLSASPRAIEKMLRTYRIRYEKAKGKRSN